MPKARSRDALNAYIATLIRPHATEYGLYLVDIRHDDWCGLSKDTATMQTRCRCNPDVTLVLITEDGMPGDRIPIMEDGRPVVYGN